MAKFLSRLFSGSSKRSFRGSQPSINENNQQTGTGSNLRSASSLDNLSTYQINPRELEKHKLHKASWEGNLHKVERLVRPNVIDLQDQQARTPLHLAVARGHFNIVQRLVHEGARLNITDKQQRTPLVMAVISSTQNPPLFYQVCMVLLQGGADSFINAVDIQGKNALHYAIDIQNEPLVDAFLSSQHCNPDFPDRDQMTPLHLAVRVNNPRIIQNLLSENRETQADPNLTNRNGHTPLHMAASLGYMEIIRTLLQSDLPEPCDPSILDARQLTAYQLALENHHESCAKLIDEYQQGWTKLSPRREISESMNENEINPVMNSAARYLGDDQESSDSRSSSPASNSNLPSMHINRQENQTLAAMIKMNPLQPETHGSTPSNQTLSALLRGNPMQPETHGSAPSNQALSALLRGNPLQPETHGSAPSNQALSAILRGNSMQPETHGSTPSKQALSALLRGNPLQPETHGSAPSSQAVSALLKGNPLQPDDNTFIRPGTASQKQSLLKYQRQDSDASSASRSSGKSPSITNRTVGQPLSPKKNVTMSAMINALPHPDHVDSNSNSWTFDKSSTYRKEAPVRIATRIPESDDTSAAESDDDNPAFRVQPPQQFNAPSVFTGTATKQKSADSDSDEDSIEAAVRRLNAQKASLGIQNLVNPSITPIHKTPQPQIPIVQSPVSEEYLWSTSSKTLNKEQQSKGVGALLHNQPLLNKKSNEPTWDDSRPLSADFERKLTKQKSQSSISSNDSDSDQDKRSSTIVRAPTQNGTITSLIKQTMRPTDPTQNESTIIRAPTQNGTITSLIKQTMRPTDSTQNESTGVENLRKIIEDIQQSSRPNHNSLTPKQTTGRPAVAALVMRNDSSSSSASTFMEESSRTLAVSVATNVKQSPYHDDPDKFHWPQTTNDRNDFKHSTGIYSNEMISPSQRQPSRNSIHNEFNSLRGSMSSSTSSIQNNMERLSELKADIKQIERKQEDSLELKRQLKDMEIKKNNFEALYKKNDQLLRETETKLEKEISEKQRLEWTTKNLNMELKGVKQKLQSLEEEKDILNQRCLKLKEERDNYDEKLRVHQATTLQTAAAGILREEDVEKIKLRHREEMKLLSAENEDLHQRTKQLQSDLQLHKESLDVTIRYKIDLEKALEEKTFLQHELERLKHEKDLMEQEKIDYKSKYDNLQEEIRVILLDRSKLEQKLTIELQDQMKQRQRSTDDIKKYKTQIEQLNLKLGDAEARLLVLQTQNEALLASKDREIKNEFETLTHRLNMIETDKLNAEQRFHTEQKDIANKQQHVLHEPLVILTSTPLSNAVQQQQHHHQPHSPSSPCTKCDTLQRSYEQERDQRIQTEKDNERLRDVVSRQKHQNELNKSIQQHQDYESLMSENSKQIRSETERVKYELDRLRHDFDKLVSNYDPPNNSQQQAQLHSQIDTLRQFYEQEFRQQLLLSKLTNGANPLPIVHSYSRTSSPIKHDEYEHSLNGSVNCSVCTNSRVLKERLESAIDTSLADQRIQTIKQMPILPRITFPLIGNHNSATSSFDLWRKRYYV
ncbi:unnamed protein product [Rotaria magnacalcarata]|uniref:Uncharacterized protein n=4 Tax=Rotaria magnacalcarata TaxID=392030 RepID=A0A816RSL2_9BILA|nr:unnamed protein product [Rotaria magnacalcarata]CAF2076905.1 unnamed protein product [Rotaria magnacalcarata]